MEQPAVIVSPYDPKWVDDFALIESEIRGYLEAGSISIPETVLSIEHVGSTSIPGLCAKPIIDVDIVARNEEVMDAIATAVAAGGDYAWHRDMGVPGRLLLRFLDPPKIVDGKPAGKRPARNVYVLTDSCQALRNHLIIRDVLRRDSTLRDQYGIVKMDLVRRGKRKYDYTEGKTDILLQILETGGMGEADRDEVREINTDIAAKNALLRAQGIL
jgi:GrpB-like predicted nucleotidyltransferase (UPF0157 family)